jgi:hypothetical protein
MATGREIQLTGHIGEHLVAAELGRRLGCLATPFAGNVPLFDLLVADADYRSIPVQVKTIRHGAWQFNADAFLNIEQRGDVQTVKGKKRLAHPELVCVLVLLGDDGQPNPQDQFFICQLGDLQTYFRSVYKGGVRPRNPESRHCAIRPEHLGEFRDNWALIREALDGKLRKRRSSSTPQDG